MMRGQQPWVLIKKRMEMGIWTGCAGFHNNLSTLEAKVDQVQRKLRKLNVFLRMGESNFNFRRREKSERLVGPAPSNEFSLACTKNPNL